jgi:hypothetical protein
VRAEDGVKSALVSRPDTLLKLPVADGVRVQ